MSEDFIFVRGCIVSCKNSWQLECCRIMMQLFEQKHKDDPEMKRNYLSLLDAYNERNTFLNPDY